MVSSFFAYFDASKKSGIRESSIQAYILVNSLRACPIMSTTGLYTSGSDSTCEVRRNSALPEVIPELRHIDFKALVKLQDPVEDDVPRKVVEALTAKGVIVDGRLKYWPKDPRYTTDEEDTIFQDMETYSDAILDAGATIMGRQPTARSYCRPRNVEKSEAQNISFKSDGNSFLLDPLGLGAGKGARYMVDSVTKHEYKKHDVATEVNQNRRQALGNAAQMMFADPSRCFRFAVTIENTTMRLWFLSRAFCAVSEPFNFITEYEHYIHFLLATTFNDLEHLGFDPTVSRRIRDDKTVVYEYMVSDKGVVKLYRTVGDSALFTYLSLRLIGRGTRVWRVREVSPDGELIGKEHALKDYWLPEDHQSEGEIQSAIFKLAAKKFGDTDYKQYFMTILHDTIVSHSSLPQLPDTYNQLGTQPSDDKHPTNAHVKSVNTKPVGGSNISSPTTNLSDYPPGVTLRYDPRKHCRVLFDEVGTPVREIRNHSVVFRCLAEGMQGLQVFHAASFVHRDISIGNLLRCEVDKKFICKISDLEYACPYRKRLPIGARQPEIKTGTPSSMAVEVQNGCYLFTADNNDPRNDGETGRHSGGYNLDVPPDYTSTDIPIDVSRHTGDPGAYTSTSNAPLFIHNYLHDVESIWWIGMLFLS
ncbi:hypothetical protein EUX98_g4223 [Antrodiella citrinella]|uniref:Fungal-type protein kinase domain-containing protein n=1 Tax=Antrodiella citrinella TaxID=2447956 RepID=A0A4V3XIP0_9APHY|nr:hypothetical protein EUX98_g4223 [Antrodiella citrinella]